MFFVNRLFSSILRNFLGCVSFSQLLAGLSCTPVLSERTSTEHREAAQTGDATWSLDGSEGRPKGSLAFGHCGSWENVLRLSRNDRELLHVKNTNSSRPSHHGWWINLELKGGLFSYAAKGSGFALLIYPLMLRTNSHRKRRSSKTCRSTMKAFPAHGHGDNKYWNNPFRAV